MNLPNKITILRICMIPVFIIFVYLPYSWGPTAALVIFVVASLTDILDGYIARKDKLITDFGKFLDPLADKLLVTAALIVLVDFSVLQAWVAILIISREFIVTGMRLIAATNEIVIAASLWGKLKTVSQMTMVILLMVASMLEWDINTLWIQGIIYLSAALTVISGIDYLAKNKTLFNDR